MINISVISINKNNKNGLRQTIESVGKQSKKPFEFIVIDGESTDGSLEILQKYNKYLTSWISEPDTGIYHAMNKGIQKASGDYLLFLNSGDILYNDKVIETIHLELSNYDIYYSDLLIVYGNEKQRIRYYSNRISLFYLIFLSLPHPATIIRRRLFEHYGLYNQSYRIVSDWQFFLNIFLTKACKLKKMKSPISMHYLDGISNQKKFKKLRRSERNHVLIEFLERRNIKDSLNTKLQIFTAIFIERLYLGRAVRFLLYLIAKYF